MSSARIALFAVSLCLPFSLPADAEQTQNDGVAEETFDPASLRPGDFVIEGKSLSEIDGDSLLDLLRSASRLGGFALDTGEQVDTRDVNQTTLLPSIKDIRINGLRLSLNETGTLEELDRIPAGLVERIALQSTDLDRGDSPLAQELDVRLSSRLEGVSASTQVGLWSNLMIGPRSPAARAWTIP